MNILTPRKNRKSKKKGDKIKRKAEINSCAVLSTDTSLAEGIKRRLDDRYGEVSQIHNLKSMYCEAISRTYRFPTTDGSYLSVQEMMLETKLSFHIPLLYLQLLNDQETRQIGTLNSIKNMTKNFQDLKMKQISERQSLIQSYQDNVRGIITQSKSGSYFKPSIQKTEKDFEFVATNLHLQRMRVQHSDFISALSMESVEDEGDSTNPIISAVYNVVTVGAATTHCLKFKQGGLLSLLSSSEKSKKNKDHVLSSLTKQSDIESEMVDLAAKTQELYKECKSLTETLQTLISAGKECKTKPNKSSAENSIGLLSEKTCRLVSLLDHKELCRSVLTILGTSVETNSFSSSIFNAATGMMSGVGMEWEEQKSTVKTRLASLVKNIHLMLDSGEKDSDLLLQQDDTDTTKYDRILEDIKQLTTQTAEVYEIAMQGHAVYSMLTAHEDIAITYRRDAVFSQALTTCICGVATSLFSSLHHKQYLIDIANHGVLVHFESLLSTYGNENGMLEDYIVGVLDLQRVTFCCERAGEPQDDTLNHLLPTLHGSRSHVTVRLHLDAYAFDRLPDSLKRGDPIKVIPVMFNIGINEEQTLAEKFGKTHLQEYINMDSYSRLSTYFEGLKKSDVTSSKSSIHSIVVDRLRSLGEAVHHKKNKNVEILHLSSEISTVLNGVRVTSCKSAKDRTAMSVTLEQVQNLVRSHELSLNTFSTALACMRSQGTRRENTKKNIGVRKYTFTSVQLMTFPKQYRPPEGTYGKGDT